jgi:hypothetical protein
MSQILRLFENYAPFDFSELFTEALEGVTFILFLSRSYITHSGVITFLVSEIVLM